MTIEEAKANLEVIREHIEKPTEEISAGIAITSLTAGIEALEKQIPQKPIDKCAGNENWSIMICPNCKRIFWNSGNSLRYEPEWCEKCGQKILWERPDWSDEE